MVKDKLSVKGIKKHLRESDYKIELYDSLDSTNIFLKAHAQQGGSEWTVIIAESQTSGRGRMTRKFYSPDKSGIYMSILLKPSLNAENSVIITAAAAVAVSRVLENLSKKDTKIKWVNDIFIENKKVCGILSEGGINPKNSQFDWVVLGIGINVYEPKNGFDAEISKIAGAVFEKRHKNLRNRIIAETLNEFRSFYNDLQGKTFFPEYKKRMLNIARNVIVIKGEKTEEAYCTDMNSNCELKVSYPDGREEFLNSGEISVKLT